MAQISNTTVYPNIVPTSNDFVVLTDVNDNNATKTSTVGSFQELFGTKTVSVTLTSSQVLNLFTQPAVLITGVAGFHILPVSVLVKYSYGTSPYSFGGNVNILLGAGDPVFNSSSVTDNFNLTQGYSTASVPHPITLGNGSKYTTVAGGDNILAKALVSNPTGGDGTITVDIMYRLIQA